jgi:activator of HSP90 ATPase
MVLHNPNNWHWVNKDVSTWAKEYLEGDLVGISAEEGNVTAKIDKVVSMEGDVDVCQRKGKVISLFDVKVRLEYIGHTADKEEVTGSITIPEVAHDTEEDEYVFEVDIFNESSSKQPVKDLVRSKIVPQLRERFQKFGPALIAEHGKDLQHPAGSNPSSGVSTPKYNSSTSIPTSAPQTSTSARSSKQGKGSSINVTKLTESAEFRTTADELFNTFTDPQRLAAFTRAPPGLFEGAKEGGRFELFGKNVSGEFVTLERPTRLVQKWRLAQWPEGHYSTLTLRFDQNDVDHVTVMRVEWDGVPVGQEEVTSRNWNDYYVRSIKVTFGFGTVL